VLPKLITTLLIRFIGGMASEAGNGMVARVKDWLYDYFRDTFAMFSAAAKKVAGTFSTPRLHETCRKGTIRGGKGT
jgi:hypothetical protein